MCRFAKFLFVTRSAVFEFSIARAAFSAKPHCPVQIDQISCLAYSQRGHESNGDAGAGGAQRMAEGDGASVDVHLLAV